MRGDGQSRCFADNEGSSKRMAICPQSNSARLRVDLSFIRGSMRKWRRQKKRSTCFSAVISSFRWMTRREMATERKHCNLTRSRYLWIYLPWLDAFVGISARGEGSDGYPFQTSVFGTKIQLTLQLITLARIEGTARAEFKLICIWVKPGETSYSC